MEDLTIVYNNANYQVRYEKRERPPFRHENGVMRWCQYRIYFEDSRLKEQFGDPFEFLANIWKKIEITGIRENSAEWHMADAILKSLK